MATGRPRDQLLIRVQRAVEVAAGVAMLLRCAGLEDLE